MEVVELNVLNAARAPDFVIHHVIGSGQNGIVVSAKCTRKGLAHPDKLYAVKLLFNFTHEYSSVIRNTYENEWLILSRLLPHDGVVRFWSQFISVIPPSFAKILPESVKKFTTHANKSGKTVASKGQFLVLDYHPEDFKAWSERLSSRLSFETVLRFTEQLLEAVLYLEKNLIRHLDLKLSNLLVAEDERIVLCDFGCAMQFEDESFTLPFVRGSQPGGNRAHLAPEVLSNHHRALKDPSKASAMDYAKQASFAAGVIICEMATGNHPLPDYPLGYTNNGGTVLFSIKDLAPLPSAFPKSFCSIVTDLLSPSPEKRLPISEALNQLRLCCIRRMSNSSNASGAFPSAPSSQSLVDYKQIERERDIAKAKLAVVATERDFAMREMKEMAEQCQRVAAEFQSMADHCDHTHRELEQVRGDRDTALKACESAYEANELLKDQVKLVSRERDLAHSQVEELRELTVRCRLEDNIRECSCCHGFYLESDNTPTSCYWHTGWSCCYKQDINAQGCKSAKHVAKETIN